MNKNIDEKNNVIKSKKQIEKKEEKKLKENEKKVFSQDNAQHLKIIEELKGGKKKWQNGLQ